MTFKYEKQYRLPGYNYAAAGYYFVTICTHNRECYFGDIVDDEMRLSPIAEIAKNCWLAIPRHFNFVSLDEWCIQPNHVHGIIIIRTFKGTATIECRKRNLDFFWQPRFHDHIIRNEQELYKIRRYIKCNHLKWHKDINNPKNFPID